MESKKRWEEPEELTIQKLRTYPGLENLSDEEAQERIFALKSLAAILFQFLNQRSQKNTLNNKLKRAA